MSGEFSDLEVLPFLPNIFELYRGGPIPPDLIGATIVRFGRPPMSRDFEGGGLIIDYLPALGGEVKRLVLEMNECGMWISGQERDVP